MTQAQMNFCADADFRSADQALNQVYNQMRNVADRRGKGPASVEDDVGGHTGAKTKNAASAPDYLRAAQRAWLSYRDKECLSRTNGGPQAPGAGSIAPMDYTICLTTLTRARVADLQKQRACSLQVADQGRDSNGNGGVDASSGVSNADCSH